jgi:hypothetical protein
MRRSDRNLGKQEPDTKKCRTDKVGARIPGTAREMYYCKIDNEDCRFVMPFGFDYICMHLNNHEFYAPPDEDHGKIVAMFLTDPKGKCIYRL